MIITWHRTPNKGVEWINVGKDRTNVEYNLNQAREAPELKHISKGRKRNQLRFP